jgi:RHS repeat-associated protein
MAKKIFLLILLFAMFPAAPRTALISTELTYDPMSAKGAYSFVPYLDGAGKVNLVNGNLVFNRQLVTRPGRAGLAVDISLNYNSKIWARTGNTQMSIAEPGSYVGLGWRIGFPYLVQGSASYALVLSDGSSHEIMDYGSGDWRSVDSTYIKLSPSSPPNLATATLAGGTQIIFGNTVGAISYATEIKDRNGNKITAAYVAGTGKLSTVTDTQNSTVAIFSYTDGMLSSIESYGKVYAVYHFSYMPVTSISGFAPSFPSPFVVEAPGSEEKVLTSSYISFTDEYSSSYFQEYQYNSFGELQTIVNRTRWYLLGEDTGEWEPQDTATVAASYYYSTQTSYDDGMTPSWQPQRMITTKRDYRYDLAKTEIFRDTSISYETSEMKSNPSQVTVSNSDGRTIMSLGYSTSGRNWSDGLVLSTQRKSPNGATLFRTVASTWTQDDISKNWVFNPRVTSQVTTLDNSLTTQVDTTYTADNTGNVHEVVEKGFDGQPYRITTTSYWHEAHSEYTAKNLTNLVSMVSVKNGSSIEVARSTRSYDEYASYPMTSYASVPMHDSSYGTSYTIRGNATSVGQYYLEQSRYIYSHAKYDITGNVVWAQDPNGSATTTTYYPSLYNYTFPLFVTNPLNQTTQFGWRWTGSPVIKIDANGQTSQWLYDWADRKVGESLPGTQQKTYGYDDADFLAVSSSSSGTGYVASNSTGDVLQTQKEDPVASDYVTQTADYNFSGQVTTQSVPFRSGGSGANGTYTYDALGRVLTIHPPSGGQVTYQYTGNETIVTDPEGRRKKTLYNEKGQIIKVTEEDQSGNWGPETTYSYNTLGNLVQVTQGAQTRTFAYNSLGRKTSETHPESGAAAFVFDDSGNTIQKTDARGVVTGYSYDELNRLELVSHSDSTLWSLYTYDESTSNLMGVISNGKGRMTSAWTVNSSLQTTSESVGYSWNYDAAGRVVQQAMRMDSTDYPLTYSYNTGCGCAQGDLQSITYPDTTVVNYTRDSIGRITGISTPSLTPYVYSVTYGLPDGSPSTIQYNSNASSKDIYVVDSAGRLSSEHLHMPGTQTTREVELTYTYSSSGQITRIDNVTKGSSGNVLTSNWYTYAYDRLARLTSETYQSGNGTDWSNSWSYDRYGNLTGTADEANNRLTAFAGNYDAAGNQMLDANNSYQYDAQNLIKQVNRRSDNALLGTYRYDAMGRRVKKSWGYSDSGQTRTVSYSYVYGTKGEILAEYKKDSRPSYTYEDSRTRNVYMGSTLIANRIQGTLNNGGTQINKIVWLRRNHRQEVIYTNTLVLPSAMTLSSYLYSKAYGSAGSDQYPGQKDDSETGLKDFGARYYNPLAMRWNSADPLTAHIYDPQSLNKYSYVRNDPVNLVDPDGQSFWSVIKDVATAVGTTVWSGMNRIGNAVVDAMTGWYMYNGGSTSEQYYDAYVTVETTYALSAFIGYGPKVLTYDQSDPFTLEFMRSYDMADILSYIESNCDKATGSIPVDSEDAFVNTVEEANDSSINLPEAQMGAIRAYYSATDNGIMNISIVNQISIDSLFYHIPAYLGFPNIEGVVPGGNVFQLINTTIKNPCAH